MDIFTIQCRLVDGFGEFGDGERFLFSERAILLGDSLSPVLDDLLVPDLVPEVSSSNRGTAKPARSDICRQHYHLQYVN